MSAPHSPQEFKALIIQENDEFCTAFNNLTQLSVMVWRMVRYKYKTDQTDFETAYGDLISEILCPDPSVDFEGEGIRPSDFKNTILGPTSGFCEKFVKMAVQLSNLIYNWVAFEYTEEGTLTEEYKALVCGADCQESAEEVDLSYMLNYTGFEKWDVITNSVDLVGVAPYDPWPGNGMYVDMAGTFDGSHPTPSPGVMRIKTGVSIVTGQSYELKIDVAGYNYVSLIGQVRVRIFQSDNVTAILDEYVTRNPDAPFSTETFTFVAAVTDTCKIQVEQVYDIAGNDNVGLKIDDVILTNTTTGAILFYDDFSQEAPEFQSSDPVTTPDPDDLKAAVPIASLELCEKMEKLFVEFPTRVYEVIAFEYAASGVGFTDDYVRLLCQHLQDEGEDVTILAPTGVNASDNLENQIVVIWSAVTPATGSVDGYQVFRSTTNDHNTASLLATVSGSTTSYTDGTPVAGTVYYYWVRATQTGRVSGWSESDAGRALAALTPTLPAISTLKATQGFYPTTTGFIRLMFTLPAGVNRVSYKMDIYRNTVNDFPSATRIKENAPIVGYDNPAAADTGVVYDNSGTGNSANEAMDCIYWHQPPSGSTKYYFWVILKKVNNSTGVVEAISPESNSALGWVQIGTGDTNPTTPVVVTVDSTVINVPVGKTKMRVLMIGVGGSASNASPFYGAGGAGGDVLMAYFDVNPGDNWTWTMPQARSSTGLYVNTPPTDGPTSHDEYEGRASTLTGPTTEEIQAAGGLSALWTAIGGRAAPANSGSETHINNVTPIEYWIERGEEGQTTGTFGGRGGAAFGFNRPGTSAASITNASSRDATKYSGSSGVAESTGNLSGGNNGVPYMLYTFID